MSRLMTKPTKWHVHPAKTQISLGIRPVWSDSSLSAWRKLGSLAIGSIAIERTAKTLIRLGPRLIWVFAGRTLILLVLSCRGSIFMINLHISYMAGLGFELKTSGFVLRVLPTSVSSLKINRKVTEFNRTVIDTPGNWVCCDWETLGQ